MLGAFVEVGQREREPTRRKEFKAKEATAGVLHVFLEAQGAPQPQALELAEGVLRVDQSIAMQDLTIYSGHPSCVLEGTPSSTTQLALIEMPSRPTALSAAILSLVELSSWYQKRFVST